MKIQFRIPGYWVAFQVSLKKREGKIVAGICNKLGHQYLVFLDYDYDNIKSIRQEIMSLQNEYTLGNAYLFKTTAGYHVYFMDLMNYDEFVEILDASSCDKYYKSVPKKNNIRTWILRTTSKGSNKITFEGVIENKHMRPLSRPHLEYILIRGVPKTIIEPLYPFSKWANKKVLIASYEA